MPSAPIYINPWNVFRTESISVRSLSFGVHSANKYYSAIFLLNILATKTICQ